MRQNLFFDKLNKNHFNGQVYMYKKDVYDNLFCLGYENYSEKKLISKASVFPIASGTKFITALAVYKLIAEKKLNLHSKAKDILDLKIETYDPKITIKDLITHQSGMPDYYDEFKDDLGQGIDNLSLLKTEDYLPYFPKTAMEFKPKKAFRYNNSGYVYLALIIEKITGLTYPSYINEHLLKPLNIMKSGVFKASEPLKDKVMGYLNQINYQHHIGYVPEVSGGDGGAYIHYQELIHLIATLLDEKPFNIDFKNILEHDFVLANRDQALFYGCGLWAKKMNNQMIYYAEGCDPGISFRFAFNINYDAYYFIASNLEDGIWAYIDNLEQMIFS